MGWPLSEGMGPAELEARLLAVTPSDASHPPPAIPDWKLIHAELLRPNVTLRRFEVDPDLKTTRRDF